MKRVLSFLMAVLLVFGLLPNIHLHVHAAETKSVEFNVFANEGTLVNKTISWTSDGVTFANNQGKSTTAIRTSDTSYYRVYANSTVVISAPGNITKIVITSTGSSYNTPWVNSAKAIGTASNSGNTITVVPTTPAASVSFDATAQVRLSKIVVTYELASTEPDVPLVVSFSVSAGQTAPADQTCDANNQITLPSMADPEGYTFVGWAGSKVEETTTKPTIYPAGDKYTASEDCTLYAVYSYETEGEGAGSGAATEYALFSGDLTEGDYVIVYNNGAMNTTVSSSRLGYTTVTITNNKISNPAASIVWHIAPDGNYWTIYNSTQKVYAAGTGAKNKAGKISSVTDFARWTVSGTKTYEFVNKGNTAANVNANLRRNGTVGFACYSTGTGGALSLYKAVTSSVTTYYTSEVSGTITECEHTNTTETTVAATCETAGSVTVTCNDCDSVISTKEIPATGHTPVTDAAKEPTCVDTGLTEGSHCSVCNAVLVAQQTVPATGEHTYVDGECSVCGEEKPTTAATVWELVTDVNSLAVGDKIVIVAAGENYALSTNQKTNNRGAVTVNKSGNTVEVTGEVQILTLVAGQVDGTFGFSFVDANGVTKYLYAASTSGNYLKSQTSMDVNSSWKISISGETTSVVATSSANRNVMQYNYNNGSPLFACYATASQSAVAIYKETVKCSHDNVVDMAEVPATCTSVGYTAGKQCVDCGNYTEGHEEIPMVEHSYNNGVQTTAPGCETTGVKTYTCTACGHSYTEVIPATGHSYQVEAYDKTGDTNPYLTKTCANCNAVNETYKLRFNSANLILGNDLRLNFKVDASAFGDGLYSDPYVVFTLGERVGEYALTVRDYTVEDGKYVFSCYGITPSQIGDVVSATMYATYGDTVYSTNVFEYSVKEYCHAQLAIATKKELQTVLVDLLNYGAAAQLYTTYRQDTLCNADLTDVQKGYGSEDTVIANLTSVLNVNYKPLDNAAAKWKAVTLVLRDTVVIRVRFEALGVENVDELSVKMQVGNTVYEAAKKEASPIAGQYYAYFDDLTGRQMSQQVEITVYQGENAISSTMSYSVESYAYAQIQKNANAKLVALVKAMMKYGYAAVAYLN